MPELITGELRDFERAWLDEFKDDDQRENFRKFIMEFLRKPGRHLIGLGHTESGKTQKAFYFVRRLINYETIVWLDCGKSYDFGKMPEIGPLFNFGMPVNIVVPAGMAVQVENSPVSVTIKEAMNPDDIWNKIEKDSINIFIIAYFFTEPDLYAKYMAQAFKRLIYLTQHGQFNRDVLPMTLFVDEFHDICPNDRMALSSSHIESAKRISWNINKIRSSGIRILGFTQKWTFVYPNARIAFQWILCCRGAYFDRDEPDLMAFNRHYKKMDIKQAILWFPKRLFHDHWNFPFYPEPDGLKITYKGSLSHVD